MEKRETPWTKGLIVICQKCGAGIEAKTLSEEGNTAENLKTYLRKQLAKEGLPQTIRVIPGGCLSICEGNKQAIAYMPCAPTIESSEVYVCHPENDREKILRWVKGKL